MEEWSRDTHLYKKMANVWGGEEEKNHPITECHANQDWIENNRAKMVEKFADA